MSDMEGKVTRVGARERGAANEFQIVEDLQAVLAQLKFARCPHLLTASLAVLPSMSLIPFAPFAEIARHLTSWSSTFVSLGLSLKVK